MKIAGVLASAVLVCTSLATAQSGFPKPPEPADRNETISPPIAPKPRIDTLQLQRDARELSDLAKSLPSDMDRVSHGLLPKDTIDKLKRIEKLSKRMRGEINP
jgi:hypothetical protein